MGTPTKEAIIGTFINGRNAQDDFLQLASNRGGTVFAWIDAAGHLQGSFLDNLGGVTSLNSLTGAITLAAGTNVTIVPSGNTLTINATQAPGGSNTDVQFNNNGVFGGDPTFTWDNVGKALSFINSTPATSILNQNSPALVLTGQAWVTSPSPQSVTVTYQIQNLNGILQFSSTGATGPSQYPFQFNEQVLFSNTVQFGAPLNVAFATGNGGGVFTATAAANAFGATTTYTVNTIPAAGNPVTGQNVTIAGFATHTSNNGYFAVAPGGDSTHIVVYNSSGVAESHTATITLDTNYDTSIGQYSAQLGVISAATFPIAGTSYIPNNVFGAYPNSPLFVMTVKGESQDAAYQRILNDGSTGNHGLEIGAIIDGTGAAPVTLQLGEFNGTPSAVLNVPLTVKGAAPTGGTGQLSIGATIATSANAGSNGDVPAQVVGYLIFDLAGTKIKVPYYAT